MPRRLLSHVSYANVVATAALFIALGGTTYAAIRLPKNSVGSKQLKANAVTSSKVKAGTLQTSDFTSSVRSGLKGETGARGLIGPAGPAGPAGAAGAAGATNVVMRQGANTTITHGTYGRAEVSCSPGERATGGGVFNEANVLDVQVTSSYPLPNPSSFPATGDGKTPTGWRVWLRNDSGGSDYTVNAYVICAAP